MGNSTSTTQNNKPYAAAEPLIKQGLRDARGLYDAGGFHVNPYGGDLVADRTPYQTYGDQLTAAGVPGAIGASQAATGLLTGAMDPTQVSQGVIDNTIASIMPSINATFAGSGMTGSSLHQQNLAKGLGAGVANVFENAQNRAINAVGMLPTATGVGFNAADRLAQVGAGQQQHQQNEINAQVLQDQQRQTAAMDAINNYLAMSTGAGSQFGVTTQRTTQNPGLFSVLGLGAQMVPFF